LLILRCKDHNEQLVELFPVKVKLNRKPRKAGAPGYRVGNVAQGVRSEDGDQHDGRPQPAGEDLDRAD
jgi:hypothetical protein